MRKIWQQFVRLLGSDPETAGTGLLIAVFMVVVPVAVLIYLLIGGHFAAAGGLALALAVLAIAVVRDYRRGRWSFVSAILAALWLMLLLLWATYDFWGPSVRR